MLHYRFTEEARQELIDLLDTGYSEMMCSARGTDSESYADACRNTAQRFSEAKAALEWMEPWE